MRLFIPIFLMIQVLIMAYPPSGQSTLATKTEMPEFYGEYIWHNQAPLHKNNLVNQVVLVAFWNFSCAPCLHDVAYLKYFYDLYYHVDFQVIAIHTPDHDFENNPDTVSAALQRLGVKYAVVQDREDTLWNAYQARARPMYFLIDGRGRIRKSYTGHFSWGDVESNIRDLIIEKGAYLEEEPNLPKSPVDRSQVKTQDMTFGYESGGPMGNAKKLTANYPQTFDEPETVFPNRFYLVGRWEAHRDFFRLLQAPGTLIVRYDANGAQITANSRYAASPIRAEILLDSHPVTESDRGDDVEIKDGSSFLSMESARIYLVTDHKDQYDDHVLRFNFEQSGIDIYQLTFGRLVLEKKKVEEKVEDAIIDTEFV